MDLQLHLRKTAHRRAMHAAIARLDLVMGARAERGEKIAAPDNNHTVWRAQMHFTMVKTAQNINKVMKR